MKQELAVSQSRCGSKHRALTLTARHYLTYNIPMRFWLLTNTTYGTWLPGDRRGSIASVRDIRPDDEPTSSRVEHDLPGEPYEEAIPKLAHASAGRLKGPPIRLDGDKAEKLLGQFQETAAFRHWELRAVAIMANHFHIVVCVPNDPSPRKILIDFKAYGSRCLNRHYGIPPSETWWTTNGSKRKLKDDAALEAAINYVLYKQPNPLVLWSSREGRLPCAHGEP